jgi:hypothetical protein
VGGADRRDDGQPEAGPAVVAGAPGVRAPESLERVRQEGIREAGAVVTDLDAHVGAIFPGREDDGRPGGREAHRVGEEVVDGLADPVGVEASPGSGGDVDLAGDVGRGQAGPG